MKFHNHSATSIQLHVYHTLYKCMHIQVTKKGNVVRNGKRNHPKVHKWYLCSPFQGSWGHDLCTFNYEWKSKSDVD